MVKSQPRSVQGREKEGSALLPKSCHRKSGIASLVKPMGRAALRSSQMYSSESLLSGIRIGEICWQGESKAWRVTLKLKKKTNTLTVLALHKAHHPEKSVHGYKHGMHACWPHCHCVCSIGLTMVPATFSFGSIYSSWLLSKNSLVSFCSYSAEQYQALRLVLKCIELFELTTTKILFLGKNSYKYIMKCV